MKWACLFVVITAVMLGVTARGADPNVEDLKGIKSLGVVVEELGDEEKDLGLNQDSVKAAISLRLRANRVPISDEKTCYLYVNISALGKQYPRAVSVNVRLYQLAVLDASGKRAAVSTWHKSSLSLLGKDTAKNATLETIQEIVDMFSNDYLTANEAVAVPAAK
jgi:hypothetical protein